MKKRIHINQHVIRHNLKNPDDMRPPVTIKQRGANIKCYEVMIDGPSKLVYSPDKPLSCGARVWIETNAYLAYNPVEDIDNG
jgi:hypothetical protein